MSGPAVVVAALCRNADEVLLERRGHGTAAGEWGLPGGPVRRGEMLAESVVRHVTEATGLTAICGPFLDWDETVDDERHVVRLRFEAVVLAEPTGADPTGSESTGVALELDWVPAPDLLGRRLEAGLAEFLADQGLLDAVL